MGGSIKFTGQFGNDKPGDQLIESMKSYNVDVEDVGRMDTSATG